MSPIVKFARVETLAYKPLNFSLLVASYGGGQGALFLAQSWLMIQKKYADIAFFGLHFAMATMAIILIESGSLTILSRKVVEASHRTVTEQRVSQSFWNLTLYRLLMATLALISMSIAIYFELLSAVTTSYCLAAIPALLIWTVNVAGLLDGLRMSGFSGVSTAMPSIVSAGALLITSANPNLDKGLWLGGALSLGIAIGVALQFFILHVANFKLQRVAPRLDEFKEDAGGAITLLWATLPGQLYYRYQLQIANWMLDPSMTATYLYIKQIFVAAAQFIGFLRRVEFPDMIKTLLHHPPHIAQVVLQAQKISTIFSLLVAGSLAVSGLAIHAFWSGEFAQIGWALAIFSPFLAVNALALAFVQGLGAAGRFQSIGNALLVSTIIAATLSPAFVYIAGLYGLFIADLVLECSSLLFLLSALRKTTGKSE